MAENPVLQKLMKGSPEETKAPEATGSGGAPKNEAQRSGNKAAGKESRRGGLAVHPFLFGFLFVVMCFKQLRPFASIGDLLWCLLVVSAGVAAAQVLFCLVLRERHKPAIAASLAVIFFCFFGDFKGVCEKWFLGTRWSDLASARWVLPAALLMFLLLLWGLVRARRELLTLHRYLNVLGIALLAASLVGMPFASTGTAPVVSPRAQSPMRLGQNPPDIYYILVDGYTSPESLKKYWGYDDSPLTDFLTGQGFRIVKNAHGNSTFTPRCLSIYLGMDFPPANPALSMQAETVYYGRIIEQAEAPARLKASGYEIVARSLFPVAGEPRYYYFPKISPATLASTIWNETAAGYLSAYQTRASFGDINLRIFSTLSAVAAEKSDRPRFVYAHLMMPHPPYLFDKDGNRIERGMGIDDQYPDFYLGQLIYENRLITNAVADILKYSKTPPIIVLQGDHGFRELRGSQQQEEASTILNALYLPGASNDCIYPGLTPVNTFRMIFNHYFCENYHYVSDTVPTNVSQFVTKVGD